MEDDKMVSKWFQKGSMCAGLDFKEKGKKPDDPCKLMNPECGVGSKGCLPPCPHKCPGQEIP